MKERNFNLHDGRTGAAITVHVVSESAQNAINGIMGDGTVIIDLTDHNSQEPTNAALIKFLAAVLQVKPSQLEIVGGISGSDKLITIMDLDKETVHQRIFQCIKK